MAPATLPNLTASRVMKARRSSICPICQLPIRIGQQIALSGYWQHREHVIERQRELAAAGEPAATKTRSTP